MCFGFELFLFEAKSAKRNRVLALNYFYLKPKVLKETGFWL
jgi:hypothetical protein